MQGVLRDEKRKNRGVISALEKEANRNEEMHKQGKDFENSNIDWERTHLNKYLIRTDNWNKALDDLYKKYNVKPRKDSVLGFDTVYSASPEYFEKRDNETALEREERIDKFFEDCLEHHVNSKCQGDRDRVINAVIHKDETTYHMQIFTASIWHDAEKNQYSLNAKKIFGNRKDMSTRQQSFYDDVLKSRGFDERKIKTELETDHKTQAQHRKEQKAEMEQQLKDLSASILRKEERQQTLARNLEELNQGIDKGMGKAYKIKEDIETLTDRHTELDREVELLEQRIEETKQALEEYNQERRKAVQNIETVRQLNDEIDKITRMEPRPPAVLDEIPAKKKFGRVVQAERVVLDKEEYSNYKEKTKFQKSDVWNLSKVETAITRLWQSLESLDIQRLKAEYEKQRRELNRERQAGDKLRQQISNMVYDLNQLQQAHPGLTYEIQNIITQEPPQEKSQGQTWERD